MNKTKKRFVGISFSILGIMIVIACIFAFLPKDNGTPQINDFVQTDVIEELLKEKYDYISEKNEEAIVIINSQSDRENIEFFDSLATDFAERGIGFFHYERGRLQHWSTNDIPMPVEFNRSLTNRFLKLENGVYLCGLKLEENHAVVGVFQIKKEYSYENDKLIEAFHRSIDIPAIVDVGLDSVENSVSVRLPYSNKDIYFCLSGDTFVQDHVSFTQMMRVCLLSLIIIAVVFAFALLARKFSTYSWIFALGLAVAFLIIRFTLLAVGFFDDFGLLRIFSPELLSTSLLQNSFGDFLLNVFLIVIWAIFFCRYFNPNFENVKCKPGRWIANILVSLIIVLTSFASINFMTQIVIDSSIPFNFVNFSNYDFYGLIATIVIAEVLFSVIFIMRKILHVTFSLLNLRLLLFLTFVLLIGCAIYESINDSNIFLPYLLFWLIWLFTILGETRQKQSFVFRTALMILGSLLVACTISQKIMQKESDAFKVLAYNMSAERDYDLEFNLLQLDTELRGNKELGDSLKNYAFASSDSIINEILLSKKYLKRYDYQTTICVDTDSLFLEDENKSTGCFDYFRHLVLDCGVIIPNTNFYFVDNNNGRQSYLGIFSVMTEPSVFVKVYIEFDSKIFSEGLGYPDLLLDKKMVLKHSNENYDFARYSKDVLVASRGSYKYLFSLTPENDFREFSVSRKKGYIHYKYCPNAENTIILSKHDTTYSNGFMIFFSVLAYIFLLYIIILIISRIKNGKGLSTTGLGQRIRVSFIGVLVVSLFLTMCASVYFIIDTYEKRHDETVVNKVHSVAVELAHSLNLNNLKNEDAKYVHDNLVYLSNILYVDINIYDVHGVLMSSSRKEFFDKGLKGRFMDQSSYRHLIMNNDEMFVHDEVIDRSDYLSVYLPLKNDNNQVVAYLNLPYFSAKSEIDEEMSNYISVFASIFLLLIFFTLVAGLLISRQVTTPLSLLQNSISGMEINKAKKINYERSDEIGLLINEYNRKVDELAESAQKLATSERESAWREMARQIAHEIRNPLTPMKLRIQYLERAYKENAPGWEKMLEQIPQMLIEQIDVLDSTASQFSEFAKMHAPQKKQVNLREIIDNVVKLHNGTNGVKVAMNCLVESEPIVSADRDQILRVFTNLVKNSIQAIPDDREGNVLISIVDDSERYIVSVHDNGYGIADEVKTKIFQPNFTTKSSGMGLGLSMVKSILFGNGVEIDFETEVGVGTEFKLYFEKRED